MASSTEKELKKSDWVYDELLCFLGSPLFQIPVLTFMESHCLVFDPITDDCPEYRQLHKEYSNIVSALLEGFLKDVGLSNEDMLKGLRDLTLNHGLRDLCQIVLEQVLSAEDLRVFVRLMTQKNIELQQQALMLIIHQTGRHDILQPRIGGGRGPLIASNKEEEDVLQAVLQASRREFEKYTENEKREKEELRTILIVSRADAVRLQEESRREQEKLNKTLHSLHLAGDDDPGLMPHSTDMLENFPGLRLAPNIQQKCDSAPRGSYTLSYTHDDDIEDDVPESERNAAELSASAQQNISLPPNGAPETNRTSSKNASLPLNHAPRTGRDTTPSHVTGSKRNIDHPKSVPGLNPVVTRPPLQVSSSAVSSSEAATNWLKSAQQESPTESSEAVAKAVEALGNLSPLELQKRQEYLRQQRDKLLEMKRKEREKQLTNLEKTGPERPSSARAARHTMDKGAVAVGESSEEEKKRVMRKAIADRIKAEVMGGK